MRKRDWLWVLLPLVLTWGLDRITKEWATNLTGVLSIRPFSFVLHHNHGAMLGLFTDLPGVLRVVTLSTGGAFILCTYAMIQFLLPIKSMLLRMGLSTLVGGILGNVADRIFWGYVVDFIVIGNPNLSSPAFNLADAFQWVGYAMIVIAIIREGQILWPENDVRKRYWINKRFQLKYSFFLASVGLGLTLVSLVFSYTYLRVTISELVGNNQYLINKFLVPFIITYGLICMIFCGVLFALGKYVSHRIAGPLYAFERFLLDALDGKNRNLKLRAGDDFKHLELLGAQIQQRLQDLRAAAAPEESAGDLNPGESPKVSPE
ncbi:MAG: signal peptidase II [Bdellovibrionaceae bacterium]|nr:signal peptidase II [Pseudobdellovibrionaceae bacterium]